MSEILESSFWPVSTAPTSLSQGYFPLWVGPRRRKPWKISSMPLGNQSTPDDRIWRSASRPSIGRRKCQSNRLRSDVTRDVIRRKTLPRTIMTVDTPLCPCHLTYSTKVPRVSQGRITLASLASNTTLASFS